MINLLFIFLIPSAFASKSPEIASAFVYSFDEKKVVLKLKDQKIKECIFKKQEVEKSGYFLTEGEKVGVVLYMYNNKCEIINKKSYQFFEYSKKIASRR